MYKRLFFRTRHLVEVVELLFEKISVEFEKESVLITGTYIRFGRRAFSNTCHPTTDIITAGVERVSLQKV